MELEPFREELESKLLQNVDCRRFIPDNEILRIVSDDVVRASVEQSTIEPQLREDCIDAVLAGGRRVLAILLMLDHEHFIAEFVEKDFLLKDSVMDSRLPFSVETLEAIFSSKRLAIRFENRQWEVTSPYFRSEKNQRIFPENIVLPFTHQEVIREGGFGQIWKVRLPSRHHGFELPRTGPSSSNRLLAKGSAEDNQGVPEAWVHVVRKIIKQEDGPPPSTTDPRFKNEERILALLRCLRHRNMVQLLASFTIQKRAIDGIRPEHNLLFPLAETDLWSIMRTNQDEALHKYFPSKTSIFQELYGLSSAIEALHDYFSGRYNLALIGCHYDLNPRNILVSNGKLLLTDFGLSRLRSVSTSKSIFAAGKGDYLAPECEPIEDDNFTKGIVSRPSDIWSFGCVLLEILVCMHLGARTVDIFHKQRKAKVLGCFTAYQFHKFGQRHPVVHERLDMLRHESPPSHCTILDTVASILQIDPTLRPKAADVTVQLYVQVVRIEFDRVWEKSRDMTALTQVLEGKMEHERLFLWGWASDFVHDSRLSPVQIWTEGTASHDWLLQTKPVSDLLLRVLDDMAEELDYILENLRSEDRMLGPDLAPLRSLVDSLFSFMPHHVAKRSTSLLQDRLLDGDDSLLQQAAQIAGHPGSIHESYQNIVLLAKLKHMTSRVEQEQKSQARSLLMHESLTTKRQSWHLYSTFKDEGHTRKVLVEWIPFSRPDVEHDKMDELYDRIQALAELLRRADMPSGFRILRSLGYFLDISQSAFGMVYQFPSAASEQCTPWTLKEVIQRFQRPVLGSIFMLARNIAFCVLQFHRTNWLHKNISTYNVVFFHDLLPTAERDASRPHRTTRKEMRGEEIPTATAQSQTSVRPVKAEKKPLFSKIKATLSTKEPSKVAPKSKTSPAGTDTSNLERAEAQPQNPSSDSLTPSTKRSVLHAESEFQSPYLVGFNHTRPDEETAFTSGTSREIHQRPYQHPECQMRDRGYRFRTEFDYYSLGVVLLEIGLWTPLEELVVKGIGSYPPRRQKDLWLDEFVPALGPPMGEIYREAVRFCLTCEDAAAASFEMAVVNELGRCCA